MFGYVRPHSPELKVKEHELYRSVYCGVCRSLGKCTGKCSRACLSYDAVLLALFRMATTKDEYRIERRRCIAHPFKRRNMLCPCEATDYAARMNAALAYYNILDDLQDNRGLRRFATKMARPSAKRWWRKAKLAPELQEQIEAALRWQTELEQQHCSSIDEAAQPFGELLSAVFAHGVSDAQMQRIAAEFGMHIGRCIYYMDAADDYEKDQKRGRYNPFLLSGVDPRQNCALRDAARLELSGAAQALSLVEAKDVSAYAILENIVYDGLVRRLDSVLQLPTEPIQERQDLT